MAHPNLVMIHPFRDSNGRIARALATLVLTRSDIGEPDFASIGEWLGANTDDYYSVIAHTRARLLATTRQSVHVAGVQPPSSPRAGTNSCAPCRRGRSDLE